MFHFVRNRRWLVSVILVLVAISVVFWGLGAYLSSSQKEVTVLSFARHEMSLSQVKQLIHAQQSAYRQVLGNAFDPALFLSESIVFPIIDRFIDQQLINEQIYSGELSLSDDWLAHFIMTLPDYQDNGHFSHKKYVSLLTQNGLTPQAFENDVRRKILAYHFSIGSLGTSFISQKMSGQMLSLLLEQRHVSACHIMSRHYLPQITITDQAVKDYYHQHAADFTLPDTVSCQYLVLSLKDYEDRIVLTDQQKRAYYAAHKSLFMQSEKRHLYSILFFVPSRATASERETIYQQALSVLEQLKRKPALFSSFARQYSADANAQEKAGDQSWVTEKDIDDKAWAQAIFKAKPRTFFLQKTALGYQLTTVKQIKKAHVAPYATVQDTIQKNLKTEKAAHTFPAEATRFSDMSDDNPRSLALLAKTFHLTIQVSPPIQKGVQPSLALFRHPSVLEAIFSSAFTSGQLNSPVLEVQPNVYLVAHVQHFVPAHLQPFEVVRSQVMTLLRDQKARHLAQGEADRFYHQLSLHQAVPALHCAPSVLVSRDTHPSLAPAALMAIFSLPEQKGFPAYSAPVADDQGYTIFRVDGITHPDLSSQDAHIKKLSTDLVQSEKNADFMALLYYWRHMSRTTVHYDAIAQGLHLKADL